MKSALLIIAILAAAGVWDAIEHRRKRPRETPGQRAKRVLDTLNDETPTNSKLWE